MHGRLWSVDESGEPWLGDASENPYVMVANPKRQRKGPRKGVMPSGLARYWASHRRKSATRKNPASRAVTVRRSRPKVTVIKYRRNPGSSGGGRGFLSRFPDLATVGGVTLGFAAPGIIAARLGAFLPASVMASPVGFWAVKAASAILPPLLLKKFGQVKLGVNMLIGGVVSLAVDLLKKYFPTYMAGMGSQPMLGYYTAGQLPQNARSLQNPQIRRLASGGMGMYTPNAYPGAAAERPMIATTPRRLSPLARF